MKRMWFVKLLATLGLLLGTFPVQAAAPQTAVAKLASQQVAAATTGTGSVNRQALGSNDPAKHSMNATGGATHSTLNPATGRASFVGTKAGHIVHGVDARIAGNRAHIPKNASLVPLLATALGGRVTDADTGWPLYASIDVAGPSGDETFWTNPETGDYALSLPSGVTYTLTVNAWVAGYQPATSTIHLSGDTTQNFELEANRDPCTAPGYGSGTVDVIQDGGFESGVSSSYWQTYTVPTQYIVIQTNNPHTGTYSALHGGRSGEMTAMTQTLTLPQGTAELNFWVYVTNVSADADDWMRASIDGNLLYTINGSQSRYVWTYVTLNVSDYADGNPHILHFNSYTDGSTRTYFYVDDVALRVDSPCLAPAGGLVVGNVYDANTGLGLDGAAVINQDGYVTTTTATPDPAVDEGFYTRFSPPGAHVFTASMTLYSDDIQTANVITNHVVRRDFDLNAPLMEVAPTALGATLNVVAGSGETTVESFTITNTGAVSLDWSICQPNTYDNGTLVNSPGTGNGGADESMRQNSLGMNHDGFDHSITNSMRIADDFTLTACTTLEEITFFAYQTGSTLSSTIAEINFRIWDGSPDDPGSQVIFGDTTTNRLLRTQFSGIYRVSESTPGGTERPIMASVVDAGGIVLPPGAYWLDWQTGGSLASESWAPPITINEQITTGNAIQFADDAWTPVMDVGQQGFPFLFNAGVESDLTWATSSPLSGTLAPASSKSVAITFDSTGLSFGHYADTLFVGSNAPTTRQESVALTLDVPSGMLHGLVSDANTSAPIADALITIDPGEYSAHSDTGGYYTFTDGLPASVFTVTVGASGYANHVAYPITITAGEDVTHNVALSPKSLVQVKGKVTDGSGHDWPLYARLEIAGYLFNDTIFTDPATGIYTIALLQDTPFTFTVSAENGGYLPETRVVVPTANGPDENFALTVEAACTVPGYAISALSHGDFESTTFPPAGWAAFRGENGLGTARDWQRSTNYPNTGNASAYVEFENVDGIAQDWLVTPRFTPQNGSHLTYYMRQSYDGDHGTTYTIRVSTNSQTTHADFAIIQTYQETDFTTTYQPFSVDLSAYAGRAIYAAFVMEQDNGDTWYLDDITTQATCNPVSGGMLIGNIASVDTGASLNGASVASQEYVTITAASRATPNDPNLDDGFYSLFVPFTGAHPFAAAAVDYVTSVQTSIIVADAVVVHDFGLRLISYNLTLHLVGSGAITPGVGTHNYISGTLLNLRATPSTGWRFDGWSGDLTGADSPVELSMSGHKEVTATFSALTYTLTVDTVGNGVVARAPNQTEYLYGDGVTLTATPDSGWYFGQWSGNATGALSQTTVTMDANKLVTATFVSMPPTYYTLTMHLAGNGVITPGVGAHSYLSGTPVDLSAAPTTGWEFEGWSGNLAGADNPVTLILDESKEVTATFTMTAENHAPTADAGMDQTVAPGTTVTLDGSGSTDPDDDTLAYNWAQSGGTAVIFTSILSRTTFTAQAPGVLTFTLTVSDPGGLMDSDTVAVIITMPEHRVFLPLVLRN